MFNSVLAKASVKPTVRDFPASVFRQKLPLTGKYLSRAVTPACISTIKYINVELCFPKFPALLERDQ